MNFHTKRTWFTGRYRPGVGATIMAVILATLACLSASAADTDKSVSLAQAQAALDAWRMDGVQSLIDSLANTSEGDYVLGIASNRSNDIDTSTRALRSALPGLDRSAPDQAINALLTLSDNYQKMSSYAEEAKTLREAIERYADRMKPGVLTSVKSDLALASALSNSQPQNTSISGESELPIRRNSLGTLNVDAVANGVSAAWMLDSGANYSIVSESFARRLKLEIAGKVPGIGSSTGISVDGQVAIVKEIRLGSAVLHNVAVLVVSDDQIHYKLPKGGEYQIDGALGYPVFQALGRVSFIGEKSILIGAKSIPVKDGTPLYLDGLTPIIFLDVEGSSLPFILDTGANSTSLSHTYWTKMAARASNWTRTQGKAAGLGGTKTFDNVVQPELEARLGDDVIVLKNVEVNTQPEEGEDNEPMYGRIGQDLWKNAVGFTIDFRAMRFRIDR